MRIRVFVFPVTVLASITLSASDDPWTISPVKYKDWEKRILDDSRPSQFRSAFLGDGDALHREFLRAVNRLKKPSVLAGEDVGELELDYQLLVYRLGDKRFSEVLAREKPIVRAAVRQFMPFSRMPQRFPLTEKLVNAAPEIDFPAVKMTREDARNK